MVNGILRVTIPPGVGWEWARGPKATAQMRTRARDTLCRIVTDVRPYDPRLGFGRMDFTGPPWVLHANTGAWAANVFVGIRRAHSNSMFGRTLLCLALLSASGATAATSASLLGVDRSEERRVGKECRSRWWP